MSNIYDGVFHTILNDCKQFILPFLNDVFHEQYNGSETIEFRPNEHFIDQSNEADKRRITDSSFVVTGISSKQYHLECESSKYSNKMLIRIFEYDSQIALDEGEIKSNTIKVTFPHTAVLYLRSSAGTPDEMHIIIEVPGNSIEYCVPVIKVSDYSIEDIFNRKLYILIPFYIFSHEKDFDNYNTNSNYSNYNCCSYTKEEIHK